MLETYYKMLHPTETIQNALPAITEAFVLFYGEENREFIEQKFKNMLIIGYLSPEDVKGIVSDIKKLESKKLINQFLKDIGIDPESDLANIYMGTDTLWLDYCHSIPINSYAKFLNGEIITEYGLNTVVDFLKQLYPEVTLENINDLQANGRFTELEQKVSKYKQMMEAYQEFLKNT